ncbi:ShKT domain-containing protein, partial [Haematococcus lacustris]
MVKQLNLPDSLYKSVKLLMSEEALSLSGLGVGTYLGEGDEATDEGSVAALLYSVTHGWN